VSLHVPRPKVFFLIVGMLTTTITLAMYGHARASLLTADAFDSSNPTLNTTTLDGRVPGSLSTPTILASLLPGTALASLTIRSRWSKHA